VFDNRVLRKTFELKREKVKGDLRKLRTEKLHDLYSSPGMIRVIKIKDNEMGSHVECMGEKKNACRALAENLKERIYLEDLGVDKKIILKWILGKLYGRTWTGFIWLRNETLDNASSGSIKYGEFLD
jgi:hypothetical protein